MSKQEVSEIAGALRRDADALSRALLPHGRYAVGQREWQVTARNSPTGYAISVVVSPGPKQGICGFWNGPRKGGDMLDLIKEVRQTDAIGALAFARSWLGSIDAVETKASKTNLTAAVQRRAAGARDAERRTLNAGAIWKASVPSSPVVSTYLKARKLNPSFAADDSLRGHAGLAYPGGGVFPAMIACVTSRDDHFIGVHRTYLKLDGSGKAPVDNPKLSLGPIAGGAVRLGGMWPEIGIAEGIETALACRELTGGKIPVWAALSAPGMRAFELPEGVTKLHIFADRDVVKFRAGRVVAPAGVCAAEDLAARVDVDDVHVLYPPDEMDWHDVFVGNAGIAPWR